MKIAVTVWQGRVSPVFDVSREALVLVIEGGDPVASSHENIEAPTAALKIDRVTALGIDTLICGAVSEPLRRDLMARGVNVLGFVAGAVDEVIRAFVAGELPAPALTMPGRRNRSGRGSAVKERR